MAAANGSVHATDASKAARTALRDIRSGAWDPDLLDVFREPPAILPEVRNPASEFGTTDPEWFGHPIPIRWFAGDQHAATIGQRCVMAGMMKPTYDTGCFAPLTPATRRDWNGEASSVLRFDGGMTAHSSRPGARMNSWPAARPRSSREAVPGLAEQC